MECTVNGCFMKIYCRGLCSRHYERLRRHGDVNYSKGIKHGLCKTSEYMSYLGMMNRCYARKNAPENKSYKEKEIIVCEQWRQSFSTFIADMGLKPDAHYQLDRIDNEKGYYPENCRWVTPTENARNRSNTKLTYDDAQEIRRQITDGNEIKAIAKQFGISTTLVRDIKNNKTWKWEEIA